mgnify:FL=1
MVFDELSNRVISCAIEVHCILGPGLLESAYEQCLAFELEKADIPFQAQKQLPVVYKTFRLDCGYRMDIVVDNTLLLELKSVEMLLPVHEAQLLTYLKLSGIRTGLLLNFNVAVLKKGIKRFIL